MKWGNYLITDAKETMTIQFEGVQFFLSKIILLIFILISIAYKIEFWRENVNYIKSCKKLRKMSNWAFFQNFVFL